ncbi:DUF4157 domain-containing protein [Tenacibaculum sp. MAR_2009_124]|uniref:eCIS core domain-containing protein n=1 Tax=Tenacibaculum sp. MAR_2009_124 TaxID=1250059 RepID=UPI001C40ABBA|nr:DUF4157 domain-containing protein [Tenacibaculum sp. MAR_2009_124]
MPIQDNRKHNTIQRKPNNTGLPDNLKSGIENLSGHSMDDVKVHYNSNKPAQLNAHAYAQGTNIHIASGQEKHLPHEAWHVVQQKQGRVKPTMQLKSKVNVNNDAGLEQEADIMGAKAMQAQPVQRVLAKGQSSNQSVTQRVQEVNRPMQQQMTGDERNPSNHPHEWNAKFMVEVKDRKCIVTIRLTTNAPGQLFTVWAEHVRAKWDDRFCIKQGPHIYPIQIRLHNVTGTEHVATAHHHINYTENANTKNMTEWGDKSNVDVSHEVGHMIGNKDEYHTVDNVHYSNSGAARNAMQIMDVSPGHSVMNNPKSNPIADHYTMIANAASAELHKHVTVEPYTPGMEREYDDKELRKDILVSNSRQLEAKFRAHGTLLGNIIAEGLSRGRGFFIMGFGAVNPTKTYAAILEEHDALLNTFKYGVSKFSETLHLLDKVDAVSGRLTAHASKFGEVMKIYVQKTLADMQKVLNATVSEDGFVEEIKRFGASLKTLIRDADQLIQEENTPGGIAPFTGIMETNYPEIAADPHLK